MVYDFPSRTSAASESNGFPEKKKNNTYSFKLKFVENIL
jgi:hypothetical protein